MKNYNELKSIVDKFTIDENIIVSNKLVQGVIEDYIELFEKYNKQINYKPKTTDKEIKACIETVQFYIDNFNCIIHPPTYA